MTITSALPRPRTRPPLAVYVLGAAIFAQGTSEFMIAGLLPDLTADLHITVPQAGMLITAFAIGMAIGAPVMTLLTLRLPRRLTLLGAAIGAASGALAGSLTDVGIDDGFGWLQADPDQTQ